MPQNSVLISTDEVSLGISRCGAVSAETAEEEVESQFTLVFPLDGVFVVETAGGRVSATPTKAVLFSSGQDRRVRHPHGGHDRSAFISLSSSFAEPFLATSGVFSVGLGYTTPRLDYRLRCLLAELRAGYADELETEEFAVAALEELLTIEETGSSCTGRAVVACAEEFLSLHFREQCSLSTVAQHVGYSSHHLSRSFKQVTGESLSGRRMRLRLAEALSQILDGADDLSRVAVESGFYDHSHLTNTFRDRFGVTPREARSVITSK